LCAGANAAHYPAAVRSVHFAAGKLREVELYLDKEYLLIKCVSEKDTHEI